jgi:hypothetical protein
VEEGQQEIMSKVTTTWKDVKDFLSEHELTREQRIFLFNYFNKQINAFPIEDTIKVTSEGVILANGKATSLEQREAFLTGVHSLKNNYAFNLIADQVMYQAIKKGMHDATEIDQIYFGKAALYFIDLFKKWIDSLDKLA